MINNQAITKIIVSPQENTTRAAILNALQAAQGSDRVYSFSDDTPGPYVMVLMPLEAAQMLVREEPEETFDRVQQLIRFAVGDLEG